ncbi:phosphotransferase family protein [Dictyobacter aurantiacus]|uniref:Aminoglycoside phosphotransferase domain-containing protein n=1 Tax=Dictyobacter aurantiacus TaxID=1936993 RepID=A0A401ZKU2_9CHLR|nr:aminoglycoside phosphotransferase family protein [Dictyobacter aurantiacus]GCE07442.1 hypothetical protein KDAU_47710 [Dictyobacter aurantiacus]
METVELPALEVLQALGVDGTPVATPLLGGFDMAMWRVEHEGQTYALRVFRPGAYEECEREQVVMEAAHAAGLPVPRVHRMGTWQDRPALLISWIAGRTLADELRARPWHLWPLGIAFGRTQAAINAVEAPALLKQLPESWISWRCEGEEALQDRLRALSQGKQALLHLDYHLLNVLTDGRRITGVVDWANARAGDPRADAARTISILRLDPLVRRPLIQWLALGLFSLAWRVGYQRAGGRLNDIAAFYAWSGTVLQRDRAPRYQQQPHALAPARRWTNKWKSRANL